MNRKYQNIIDRLTLEEKCALAVVQADGTGPVTVTVRDEARQETVQIPLAE